MAHTRTTNKDARIVEQCARGRRVRNTSIVPFIVANARTNMTDPNHSFADVISNDTANKAAFVAPCVCKVIRCSANALTFPTTAAGGSVTLKFTKAVIGGTDVDLCTAGAVGGASPPTAETAVDATLSTTAGALDLVEGQLVYAVILVSNHAISARSSGLVGMIEWVPLDTGNW